MAPASEPPIAVVCALECELAHLRGAMADAKEDWFADRCAWIGRLHGRRVVLSMCGMGMTSAAAVTEAVIVRYRPVAVLNSGCAGAHRADLLPGDIVVADRVVAYDNVREAPDGTQSFGNMHYLHRGVPRSVSGLDSDPELLQLALRVEGNFDPWPADVGWPTGVPHRAPRVVVGTVVSADRWNRAESSIRALAGQFDSLCEDMEAAAVALVCASHDVPFLAIKDIVNNELLRATQSGRALLAEVGEHQVGRRSAAFVLALLTRNGANEAVVIAFRDAVEFEAWLDVHVDLQAGVWLKIAKRRSGVPSLTDDEAVDIGLCYGWISGQRKSCDEVYYLQKYVPRRPHSHWSRVNVAKVEQLIAAGRMRPSGLAEVDAAKADGRWAAALSS